MRQFICAFMIVAAGVSLMAANIRWDVMELVDNGKVWNCLHWLGNSATEYYYYDFQVFFVYDSGPWGRDWSLIPDEAGPINKVKVYEATLGACINHEIASRATPFAEAEQYANTYYPIAESWTPVSGADPRDIYFAIVLWDYDDEEVYGWAQIGMLGDENSGHLYMKHSAIDLDGGPMIVGGGAWDGATPEPVSGLLLLLGGALLALRRRRRGITP